MQAKFIDDGDFIGSPFDLDANTLTMLPFSQQADEDIVYQELRGEFTTQCGRVKNSLIVGGSYEHNSGSLTNSEFFFTEDNEDGFTINYLNPVIPPRSEWLSFTGTPTGLSPRQHRAVLPEHLASRRRGSFSREPAATIVSLSTTSEGPGPCWNRRSRPSARRSAQP